MSNYFRDATLGASTGGDSRTTPWWAHSQQTTTAGCPTGAGAAPVAPPPTARPRPPGPALAVQHHGHRLFLALQGQPGLVQQDHPGQLRGRVPRGLRLQPLHVPSQADGAHEAAQDRQVGRGRAQADAEHVQAHQGFLPGPRALLAGHPLREARMGAPAALTAPALHAAGAQQQQMALVAAVAPKGALAAMGTRFRRTGVRCAPRTATSSRPWACAGSA